MSFLSFRNEVRNWLCRFSGEDYQLIQHEKISKGVRNWFASIGLLVLFIFFLSAYSSAHFIYQLFNRNLFVAIPVAGIWGSTIVVIYLLLLYTITPAMLKGKGRSVKGVLPDDETDSAGLARMTVAFRVGFVILLAVIIAQPWLVTSFNKAVRPLIYTHKQQYRNNYIVQADSAFIAEERQVFNDMMQQVGFKKMDSNDSTLVVKEGEKIIQKIKRDEDFLRAATSLQQRISFLKKLPLSGLRGSLDQLYDSLTLLVQDEQVHDSAFYATSTIPRSQKGYLDNILATAHSRLMSIIAEKNISNAKLDKVLRSSNFYIRSIQLINSRFPVSWIMTGMVVMLFIFPIIVKYRIRNKTNFYPLRKELEHAIVKGEYASFKQVYQDVFESKFQINVSFYESCEDPPFNTKKIAPIAAFQQPERVLLEQVYPDAISEEHKCITGQQLRPK